MVDEVVKVELIAGNTMIIPTGWIHAVVSRQKNLLVHTLLTKVSVHPYRYARLRGKFLTFIQRLVRLSVRPTDPLPLSLLDRTQLKICEIEKSTNVPKKFRFPHFTKCVWRSFTSGHVPTMS